MWKKMPILPLWAHSGHRADIARRGLLQVAAFPSRRWERHRTTPCSKWPLDPPQTILVTYAWYAVLGEIVEKSWFQAQDYQMWEEKSERVWDCPSRPGYSWFVACILPITNQCMLYSNNQQNERNSLLGRSVVWVELAWPGLNRRVFRCIDFILIERYLKWWGTKQRFRLIQFDSAMWKLWINVKAASHSPGISSLIVHPKKENLEENTIGHAAWLEGLSGSIWKYLECGTFHLGRRVRGWRIFHGKPLDGTNSGVGQKIFTRGDVFWGTYEF